MKRFCLIVAFALMLFSSPAVYAAETLNQFSITNYDIDMTLSRDDERRSTLETTETITADFTRRNTNHGIERTFVKEYEDHSTSFELQSVTDEAGNELPYHWSGDTLRIGEEDVYVYGEQTYVISYSQRDVTRYYEDTNKDEWYWDIVGGEWRVPIERMSATITIAAELQPAIETEMQCYQGVSQSTDRCDVNSSNGSYEVTAENLGTYRGLTVALGFTPETFEPYQQTWWEYALIIFFVVLFISQIVLAPFALIIGGVWLWARYKKYSRQDPAVKKALERPKTPEYLPPSDASVIESAVVLHSRLRGRDISAQLLDWAVRHYVVVEQTAKKTWAKSAEYRVEVIKAFDDMSEGERAIAEDIFAHEPVIGSTVTSKVLRSRASKLHAAMASQSKKIKEGRLFQTSPEADQWFGRFGTVALVLSVLTLNVGLLIIGILAKSLAKSRYLSEPGAELKKYLEGLEYYIGVGEKERLAMLQTPEGAARARVDGSIARERIVLYEKTLPYAVLFGQEKQWANELAHLYEVEEQSPSWTHTDNALLAINSASLASLITGFSGSVTQAASYSSSSTGGSSGGGFSGGGGGGGGGGGW